MGAVRYTERFHLDQAVSPAVVQEATTAMAADLAALEGSPPPDALVGMGGAVTNLTAVMLGLAKYDPDKVQGSVIDRAEIDRQIERYRAIPAEDRRQIVGLQPNRAEVILAGAMYRAHGHGQAGEVVALSQRSRIAARRVDRSVWGTAFPGMIRTVGVG